MVFPSKENGEINFMGEECHRYSTWDDAEAGHKAIVKRLWLKLNEKRLIKMEEVK
jgi:hypothetical protein